MNFEIRKIDNQKGFGLFATHLIKNGETIFQEKPLVSAQFLWNQLYGYKACDFCMRSLETAEEMFQRLAGQKHVKLPYPQCCSTQKLKHVVCKDCKTEYCCDECKELAWNTYHQIICLNPQSTKNIHQLISICEAWRNIHYPPETCSIMLIVKLFATIKQSSNVAPIINKLSEFCKLTVNEEDQIAHKLLGQQFQNQLDMLREMLKNFLFIEELAQFYTPEGFRSLFALIGTNGQGIGTSSFSVWVRNTEKLMDLQKNEKKQLSKLIDKFYDDMDKVSGTFLDCEGSGLYSLQSKCNHSCDPNSEVSFLNNDSTLSLVALRDILPEQEILISYLDDCDLHRSRHSRLKILRENYLFNCACSKCLEDQFTQPDLTSEEDDSEGEEDDANDDADDDMDNS